MSYVLNEVQKKRIKIETSRGDQFSVIVQRRGGIDKHLVIRRWTGDWFKAIVCWALEEGERDADLCKAVVEYIKELGKEVS